MYKVEKTKVEVYYFHVFSFEFILLLLLIIDILVLFKLFGPSGKMCRFRYKFEYFLKFNFKIAVTVFVGLTKYFGVTVSVLHLLGGYVVL